MGNESPGLKGCVRATFKEKGDRRRGNPLWDFSDSDGPLQDHRAREIDSSWEEGKTVGIAERREYLSSASENLEAVKQSLENLILEIENVLADWKEGLSILPEDSEDMEEYQGKIDDYEEMLSNLEEAKGIIEDIVLEP
jgi:exonuclease VII small subunit